MAIITASTSLLVAEQVWGIQHYTISAMSNETGSIQDRPIGPPRWTTSLRSPNDLSVDLMAPWQTMIARLRGRVNHLAIWDFGRPAPRGTMRGAMSLNAPAAIGATQLTINAGVAQAAKTLVPGDWLQIGNPGLTSQLVMVTVGGTSDGTGNIVVSVENPLRIAYVLGTLVTWDKPLGYFKMTNDRATWKHENGLLMSGAAVDLVEQW